MNAPDEVENRLKLLNERLAGCIPPRETWTPAEEALFKPIDLLRVPLDEAQQMQFKAIKYAFTRHYTYNQFYHQYCEMRGVAPDDLKTSDDFDTIPLIPDSIFKQHPSGEDLAYWITSIFTGDPPHVVIEGANPTFDDVINAFNAAGLAVAYTSGTSGQHSVVPRDMRTLRSYLYSAEKTRISMFDIFVDHYLSLLPKPSQTNLMSGKMASIKSLVYKDPHFPMDVEITADEVSKAITGKDLHGTESQSAEGMKQKIVGNAINWLERYEATTDTILISGLVFLLFAIVETLEQEGKRFEFGERGVVAVGGGWKQSDNEHISAESLRKRVVETLGIPETRCFESYGMSEMNAVASTCEGHYYHLPCTWLKPLVLDNNLEPAGYGKRGRLAFLDGLANSYPAFIISGDEVLMYEHCPVCDRPGPALDPMIQRAQSVELRGCSSVLRSVLKQD